MTLRALMLDWPIPPSDHLWIASRVVHHFSPCFNLTDPSLSLSHCSPTHSLPPRFFLKRGLFFLVRLGMTRTRSQLAPAMSMQETVDGVGMHFLLHFRFKGLLNLLDRGNLAPFGSREKRLQKGLFLLESQIFMMASAFG